MGGAPATEVFPGFCIRPVVRDAGGSGRYFGIITITHETGASKRVGLEKDTFVAFPELTPDAGGTWLLSLDWGQDSQPMRWPIRETLVLKAIHGNIRDVTVEIESLQYTYEPDIVNARIKLTHYRRDGVDPSRYLGQPSVSGCSCRLLPPMADAAGDAS